MDKDLPPANVPRRLFSGSQDLSSTLSHIYSDIYRQSSADEGIIRKLETSLPTRADEHYADYVHELQQIRDAFVNTTANLEDMEKHLLRAKALRLMETPPELPGPVLTPSLDVLRQTKILSGLDSPALRKYELLVPEDFCDPPKQAQYQANKTGIGKNSTDNRILTAGASLPQFTCSSRLLPRLRIAGRVAKPKVPVEHIIRAEPPSVTLDCFEVGNKYELSLRVQNVSCTLLWLRLVPPTTPEFQLSKITFPGAHSTLASGMSLEVKLTFCAPRRTTYQDQVVLKTPLGDLQVPLVANHKPPILRMDADIDLGQVMVGCCEQQRVSVINEGGHGQFCILHQAQWPVDIPNADKQTGGASFSLTPSRFMLDCEENMEFEVTYMPISAGVHYETLTLVCDNMHAQHLPVRGFGVRGINTILACDGEFHEPAIGDHADKYCHDYLRLPDTLPEMPSSSSISVQNTSGLSLTFRWEHRPAALDIYGEDAVDVSADGDIQISPRRGILEPYQSIEMTFTCITQQTGECRAVWSLMLEQIPETAVTEQDIVFEPGWPQHSVQSRLDSKPRNSARSASTSCLLRCSRRLDLHAGPQQRLSRSRSASPTRAIRVWDVLAYEVQTMCRCSQLPLSLEPPMLRLPDPVPFWTRVSRKVNLVNDSDYSAPFSWQALRRGDLIVSVTPEVGEVPARDCVPLTVSLWSARELYLMSELRCSCDKFSHSIPLPVVATFLGPALEVSTHRIDFERTRVGERSEQQITLSNPCKLSLKWQTARIVERTSEQEAERRWRFDSLADPFILTPAEGLLKSGDSTQVTVTFEPHAPASYDMVIDLSTEGSTRTNAISVTAKSCHLSLSVTPAFHKLDAYVEGTVPLMLFLSNTCDIPVPFCWDIPASDHVDVKIEPVEGTLLPWATLIANLTLTGMIAGVYGYYCIPCNITDGSDSVHLTLYGEVMPLTASVFIPPSWGHRPPGAPDLGECREVLGRSKRAELERQTREAEDAEARVAEPPPPEPEPSPPPSPPNVKKKKGKVGKKSGGRKGKEKAHKEEAPPAPPPEPEPELEPEPEAEPELPVEPTLDELIEQWELLEPEDTECGPLVLLFGHNIDVHQVVVREFYVRNDTPIAANCWASVLHFPGENPEKLIGEPPMVVEVRRINDLEREDVWSDLLADNRGLALVVRPERFQVPAHSQTKVRVFCCADMWGWYSDQLIISGDGIPDLTVDVRVGVTGSPVLVVNTGSNHVRFGCQLYGAPPVVRHLCLNNVSPCPIQLNLSLALTSPRPKVRPPPFRAEPAVGADFEPLLPLWEWRVLDDSIDIVLRPVFGEENQTYYTVTPRVVVVPARSKAWLLLKLHPVCLPPPASRWEWQKRQEPLDVLAWLTAYMSLRQMDVAPEDGHVRRTHGYEVEPVQVQLRAQLKTAYLHVVYPECVSVGLNPPPVLAGPEDVVRMIAPVTALVKDTRPRLRNHLSLHNKHQLDIEVICWTNLPFSLVRAASPRETVETPDRCVVPHASHTQLTVEFAFSRDLLRFCLTAGLDEPLRVRFSPDGEMTVVTTPTDEPSSQCGSAEHTACVDECSKAPPSRAGIAGSEQAMPAETSDDTLGGTWQRATASEADADKRHCCLTQSLQQLLCERAAQIESENYASNDRLYDVEISSLTNPETGERRIKFASRIVLQYMDSYIQTFPVECILVLPALSVSVDSIDFDHITIGDVSRRGFYIENPTIGEVVWSSHMIARLASPCSSASGTARMSSSRRRSARSQPRPPDAATFRLYPESGVLPPRGRTYLEVTFTPRCSALYSTVVELRGPCLCDPLNVIVTGHGTADEMLHMPGA